MARKPSALLTDGELRLMQVLWHRGPATVVEMQEELEDDLVDSTIRTLLKILEDKGYVDRRKEGRAFRYFPLVQEQETRVSAVENLVRRFFGTRADLVLNLLDSGELNDAELTAIRRAIGQRTKGKGA
jgi:BlaI family penicillinase repressor